MFDNDFSFLSQQNKLDSTTIFSGTGTQGVEWEPVGNECDL